MKTMLLLCAVLLTAIYARAQDIAITNFSCQDVVVDISADKLPNCNQTAQSTMYYIKAKSTLKLSMYAGGTYPQVNWSAMGPILPGSQFTLVKVYDTTYSWVGYLFNTCWGSPNFTVAGTSCTINGASSWTVPFVNVMIN